MAKPGHGLSDFLLDLALRSMIRLALMLPYRARVRAFGWFASRILAPLAGYTARIRENLAYIFPHLPAAEVKRLCRAVPDNAGRSLIEFYSLKDFAAQMRRTPLTGPGVPALEGALERRTPVILVSGHFGNYQAVRAALAVRGYQVGGLYRPANNAFFNAHYVRITEAIAAPLFARSRHGMAGLLKHLRGGGVIGLLNDQHFDDGEILDFMGKPAATPLSAAEMALKYDALLLPVYGIRQPDGISIEVRIEAPVPASDPRTMTQALNDSLAAQVRAHMDQWLWIHRRWKPERQRNRAAARIGP